MQSVLGQLRQTVAEVIKNLKEEDRVAIVLFSNTADTILKLSHPKDVRDILESKILPQIVIQGGTNIQAVLELPP